MIPAEVYGGPLEHIGSAAYLVVGTFVLFVAFGLPAWFSSRPRRVPNRTVTHIGAPAGKGRHRAG